MLEILLRLMVDPLVTGGLSWLSFFVTTCGLAIALFQITRTRKAALAARDAALAMGKSIQTRERMLELNEAITFLEQAQEKLARRELPFAVFCLDLSRRVCIQATGLMPDKSAERNRMQRASRRVQRLLEAADHLMQTDDRDGVSALLKEVRDIVAELRALSAALRYDVDDKGAPR